MDHELIEQRKHKRHIFAYPVKFDLYRKHPVSISFAGVIYNISIGGACVQFEDKYGRLDIGTLPGSCLKVVINIPESKKIYLSALIHWARREAETGFTLLMGIEFREIEDWQIEQIEQFIYLKNKDQKMLWNLWEDYVPQK